MYDETTAYLLWVLSIFGWLGFHRRYLNRRGPGCLWLMTGGWLFLGGLRDLVHIPDMVREANLQERYRGLLAKDPDFYISKRKAGRSPRESLEKTILRTAKKNGGVATPGEVALEGDIPIEEAKKSLEQLVSGGFADIRVRKSGAIVYVFTEFLQDDTQFEEM